MKQTSQMMHCSINDTRTFITWCNMIGRCIKFIVHAYDQVSIGCYNLSTAIFQEMFSLGDYNNDSESTSQENNTDKKNPHQDVLQQVKGIISLQNSLYQDEISKTLNNFLEQCCRQNLKNFEEVMNEINNNNQNLKLLYNQLPTVAVVFLQKQYHIIYQKQIKEHDFQFNFQCMTKSNTFKYNLKDCSIQKCKAELQKGLTKYTTNLVKVLSNSSDSQTQSQIDSQSQKANTKEKIVLLHINKTGSFNVRKIAIKNAKINDDLKCEAFFSETEKLLDTMQNLIIKFGINIGEKLQIKLFHNPCIALNCLKFLLILSMKMLRKNTITIIIKCSKIFIQGAVDGFKTDKDSKIAYSLTSSADYKLIYMQQLNNLLQQNSGDSIDDVVDRWLLKVVAHTELQCKLTLNKILSYLPVLNEMQFATLDNSITFSLFALYNTIIEHQKILIYKIGETAGSIAMTICQNFDQVMHVSRSFVNYFIMTQSTPQVEKIAS